MRTSLRHDCPPHIDHLKMKLLYSTYYTSTGKVLLALYGGSATIGTSTVLQLYAWISSQYQLFSMDFSVGSSRSAPTAVPRSVQGIVLDKNPSVSNIY